MVGCENENGLYGNVVNKYGLVYNLGWYYNVIELKIVMTMGFLWKRNELY